MEINTLDDLDKLELKIRQKISKYRLGDVLYSLYEIKDSLRPFIAAGVALFAVRFSQPSIVNQNIEPLKNVQSIIELVTAYLLADPITFDEELNNNFMGSNPAFVRLRLACSQLPFKVSEFSQFSRPILLYHEIPNSLVGKAGIPKFDIHKEFLILNKVSIPEFINIGFAASAFARNNFSFSLNWFEKLRSQGISLLDDKAISQALYQLAGDQVKITTLYDKRKNSDRRFRMYDFNPLQTYPLIFPCKTKGFGNFGQDFMCAPVPRLIDERMSLGIYYQLYNKFDQKFSNYFGYVLEEYLKLILNNSINSEKFIDIRDLGNHRKSKSPDYAIIDGSVAIVLECKATKFTLAAKTISSEEAINDSLGQVKKGLIQLDTFIKARASNLDEFQECSRFMPVLVTLEDDMLLINDVDFRDHINELLKNEGIDNLDWQILSIGALELLQPHLAAGIHLSQVLQDLKHKSFKRVLEELTSQTRKSFKDSFLYPKQKEVYQRLNIPDRSE